MTAAIILGVIATYALVIGVYRGVIGEERWGGSTAHVKARITSAPSAPSNAPSTTSSPPTTRSGRRG